MFNEFFRQGDMEKTLDLPISKFMDRENTNKEKVYVGYIDIVCKPLFHTFLIIVDEEVKEELTKAIIEDGCDKNKKHLENRIDSDSSK